MLLKVISFHFSYKATATELTKNFMLTQFEFKSPQKFFLCLHTFIENLNGDKNNPNLDSQYIGDTFDAINLYAYYKKFFRAFNNAQHQPELWRVICGESPGILCYIHVVFSKQRNNSQSTIGVFTLFIFQIPWSLIVRFILSLAVFFQLVSHVLQKFIMRKGEVHIFGY